MDMKFKKCILGSITTITLKKEHVPRAWANLSTEPTPVGGTQETQKKCQLFNWKQLWGQVLKHISLHSAYLILLFNLKLLHPKPKQDFFFGFLGPHLWHMEIPRIGVKSELQLPSYSTPQQRWIWATSANYTTSHSNAGSLTHWVRPGIEPATSWFLVRFVSAEPQWELLFTSPLTFIISFLLLALGLFCSF